MNYPKFFNIGLDQKAGTRDYQEDWLETFEFKDGSMLLILADGMGGYAGGEKASHIVVETFKDTFIKIKEQSSIFNIKETLHTSLIEANNALKEEKIRTPKFKKMGTTLIAVYMKEDVIQWVSVGDSPLWLISQRYEKVIKRVNQNHSIAGLLQLQYEHDEITIEERDTSPNRHMLTSAITGEELKSIDLSKPLKISKNDILILASDGVESLSEEEILDIVLSNSKDMMSATNKILDAIKAKNNKDQDNNTIIIITNKDSEQEEPTNSNHQSIKDKIDELLNDNYNLVISILWAIIVLLSLVIYLIYNNPVSTKDTNTTTDENLSIIQSDINITDRNTSDKKSGEVNKTKGNIFETIDIKNIIDSLKKRTDKAREIF